MNADGSNKAPPEPTTVEEIARDYVPCGSAMRRKDASNEKPSPVLDAKDVLRIVMAQLEREGWFDDEIDRSHPDWEK